MKFKRFMAYVIDILIVLIICSLLNNIVPNTKINGLNHSLNVITENVLNNQISFKEYLSNYMYINYSIDKINILFTTLNIMFIIIYFIIIPLLNKGKTIGLSIFKLKIDGDVNIKNLFIRNIITTGVLYMILNVLLVFILKYKYYFVVLSILAFIQFLLVIISTFMVIYRKDEKGLQDILSNTYIEKVK